MAAGGEQVIGILAVIGDGFIHEPVTPVGIHPEFAADLQNLGVSIGVGIVVLSKGGSCAGSIDHELGIGLQGADDAFFLFRGDGVGLGLLHIHALLFIIGNGHFRAGLILNGNGGLHHQAGNALDADLRAGGADGQELFRGSRGDLDGKAVIQGYAVDVGRMAVHLLDQVAILPGKEQFHLAELPVGNIGFLFLLALQGEGGDPLLTQLDIILFVAGQTRGGLHKGQRRIPHPLVHVGNEGILAFIGGILNARQIVQLTPVRVCKQLVEDLLALDGGLGRLVIHQPVIQPVEPQEGAAHKNGDEQEIQGIENDGIQMGALFLGLCHLSALHIGIGVLGSLAAVGRLLGSAPVGRGPLAVLHRPLLGSAPRSLGTGLGHLGLRRLGSALVGLIHLAGRLLLGSGGAGPRGAVLCFKFSLIHFPRPLYLTIQKSGILLGSDCRTE